MFDRASGRLIVVSNRLPVVIERIGSDLRTRPGGGGLVSAMKSILSKKGGLWIGWPGIAGSSNWDDILEITSIDCGYQMRAVSLTIEEVSGFYNGFSNQVIWPLFHDLQTKCNFSCKFWESYITVNRKFADVVYNCCNNNDLIWVHDYHLIHVGKILRSMGIERHLGFFLHIPFPAPDIFIKLPWRREILEAMLFYDLIGFQTPRDRRHFIQCLRYLMQNVHVNGRGGVMTVMLDNRKTRLGTFPIGVDYKRYSRTASLAEVANRAMWLKESMKPSRIILGVDRLDYTKGLTERLTAYNHSLQEYPELRKRVTLIQVVVPSRTVVPEYKTLKAEVERLVGEINGRFTRDGWIPIHYLYRSLEFEDLIAHYIAADIGFVTPLIDGMNLVAKEYCACQVKEPGVLILSEFAGAAAQLQRGALLVNPYDERGVAEAIVKAFKMQDNEKKLRMMRMRNNTRRADVFSWAELYMNAAILR